MKVSRLMTQFLLRFFSFGLLAFSLTLCSAALASAAPGDLDPAFGNGGKVITPVGSSLDAATSIAIQSDGKIVAAGFSGTPGDFAVVRYTTNGTLDTSFNGTGIAITPVGSSNDVASSLAIQSDDKIVVAGYSIVGSSYDFAVVRYNNDGSLDTSFNGTGIVTTPVGSSSDAAYSVVIQSDGKIVAAGYGSSGANNHFAVVRYNTNGSLDTSFNGTGKVITPISGSGDYAYSVAIQADGKIVAAGYSGTDLNHDFTVVRYNTDGTLDTSLNGTGIVITPIGSADDIAQSVAVQSDGKIVVAGYSRGTNFDIAVVRYNTNGSLDTSFNGTGKVITQIGSADDIAYSVAIQSDGKIIAAGYSSSGVNNDFAVARYNTDGSLDTSFNGTGIVTTAIGSGNDVASSVAIQSDGKIVAAGNSYNGTYPDFALVRYLAASNVRTRFDFDGDGKADISVFRPSNGAWYLLNSTSGFAATQFGISTDKIVPADYDGDGKTDVAVYRSGTWYLQRSQLGFTGIQFGDSSDIPQPADYDGDGKADLAVFRPSNGGWYIYNLATNLTSSFAFGQMGDIPVASDYDGDGKTDIAVFRSGVWYIQRSRDGFTGVTFGTATDKPVPADYDGDGKTDVAVYRNGTWYLQQSTAGFTGIAFGISTDKPAPADYDGDGKADIAIFRDGTWYLQRSTQGFTGVAFGAATDKPIPNAFVP